MPKHVPLPFIHREFGTLVTAIGASGTPSDVREELNTLQTQVNNLARDVGLVQGAVQDVKARLDRLGEAREALFDIDFDPLIRDFLVTSDREKFVRQVRAIPDLQLSRLQGVIDKINRVRDLSPLLQSLIPAGPAHADAAQAERKVGKTSRKARTK